MFIFFCLLFTGLHAQTMKVDTSYYPDSKIIFSIYEHKSVKKCDTTYMEYFDENKKYKKDMDIRCQIQYDGKYTSYDKTTGNIITTGIYLLGLKEGEWTTYFNGTNKIESIGIYKSGKQNGQWTRYYESTSNIKSKGFYINGKKDG